MLGRGEAAAVRTTLDAGLQRFARDALARHLAALAGRNVEDGAVLVLDNATGDVLAYVASSGDLSGAAEVDGITARRQAGSTLKPFLYADAIGRRLLTAASLLDDSPLHVATPVGLYVPQNYDRSFKGVVSVRTALGASLNVPAVRTLVAGGFDAFHERLRTLGLASLDRPPEHYGYALALGGADVSLLELANAYRALANGGEWSPVRFTPEDEPTPGRRALDPAAAFIVGDVLADRGARALTFGLESPLVARSWAAVKTGTSKDMRDNWALGYSDRYTVGVWVGNFSGEPMWDVSGVSGAAPVWQEIMNRLHRGAPSRAPAPPPGVVVRRVRFDGDLEAARDEYFVAGTEMAEVRIAGTPPRVRIAYPGEGTIVALDPDIPAPQQRIALRASGAAGGSWRIDGRPAGDAAGVALWMPARAPARATRRGRARGRRGTVRGARSALRGAGEVGVEVHQHARRRAPDVVGPVRHRRSRPSCIRRLRWWLAGSSRNASGTSNTSATSKSSSFSSKGDATSPTTGVTR